MIFVNLNHYSYSYYSGKLLLESFAKIESKEQLLTICRFSLFVFNSSNFQLNGP